MVLPNVLQKQSGHSWDFNVGVGNKMYHLRQEAGNNYDAGIFLTGGQFGHKIDGDMFLLVSGTDRGFRRS